MTSPLPSLTTPVPGPRSRALAGELGRYESPNITYMDDRLPIFWESASGALVQDVDGNRFLDLSAGFGAAAIGHCHPRLTAAIQRQASTLIHGMGDMHPPRIKVELARRLANWTPGDLQQVIFGCNGSDAVEAALKTAMIATGKPGVIAFHGGYHGLSYGALNVTSRRDFRAPFLDQLACFTHHVPYPTGKGAELLRSAEDSLASVRMAFREADARGIGAVIVEPVQGRGGIIVPPDGWFTRLAEITRQSGALLIADEVFTGCGRTGVPFASEVTPDLMCIGKALGGGFPISACIGTKEVMAAWPASTGEAIHTSTFLGNPLGCAAALAVLDVLQEENLVARCQRIGAILKDGLQELANRSPRIGEVRGRGLMLGLELVHPDGSAYPGVAIEMMKRCLERGLIVLPAGDAGSVIEFTPPYIITEEQIAFALGTIQEVLESLL